MKLTLELTIDRESPSERLDNFLNGIMDRFTMIASDILTEEVREQNRNAGNFANALISSLFYGISRNIGVKMARTSKSEPKKEEPKKEEPKPEPAPGCQHDMQPDKDGQGGIIDRCTKCSAVKPQMQSGDWESGSPRHRGGSLGNRGVRLPSRARRKHEGL